MTPEQTEKEKVLSPSKIMNARLRRDPDVTDETEEQAPKPNDDMNATIRRLAGRESEGNNARQQHSIEPISLDRAVARARPVQAAEDGG